MMKMLSVAMLPIIAVLCTTQLGQAAENAKKPKHSTTSKEVIGKAPGDLLKFKSSGLGGGKVDCSKSETKCGPIGVFAGYNTELQKCVFYIDIDDINIPSKNIVVTWQLVSVDGGVYQFTTDGINIKKNMNDWDSKGHAAVDKTAYKWRSVHGRVWKSDYIVNVVRKDPDTGAFDNCDPVDPRINNT